MKNSELNFPYRGKQQQQLQQQCKDCLMGKYFFQLATQKTCKHWLLILSNIQKELKPKQTFNKGKAKL